MDILSTLNPPRLVRLSGVEYWCRQLTLEDIAILLAWLDDVLPGQSDRMTPPNMAGDEAQSALNDPHGLCVIAWAGLRHHGLSFLTASNVVMSATNEELARLIAVLFGRRRTMKPSNDGFGKSISEYWWGPLVCGLMEKYHMSLDDVRRLSLDQIDCLSGDGLAQEEPGKLSVSEVHAMWKAARMKVETNGSDSGTEED